MCHDAWNRDAHTLANAYLDATTLASRPVAASEDEPVTEDWLLTVANKCQREGWFYIDIDRERCLLLRFSGTEQQWMIDVQDCDQRTRLASVRFRGELLRLMDALGITPASAEVGK
jgi:hypothetical protein